MLNIRDGIFLLLVIMVVSTGYAEMSDGSKIVPVPTRPYEYHEIRCDLGYEQNSSLFTEYQFLDNSTTDSVWNLSIGAPQRVSGISWAGEYVSEGVLDNLDLTPEKGYDFLIIPIQIQNIGKRDLCFDLSRLNLTNNETREEYHIDEDMDFLKHPFSQIYYAPGDGGSGSIAYQVPHDTRLLDLAVRLQDKKTVYLLEV